MSESHSSWLHILFYFGLALLATHELDAMTHHEWRLMPVLNLLDDDLARSVFVVLHIPIFTVLFWLTGHRSAVVRMRSQIGVDIFLMMHGAVHFLFSGSDLYEFEPPIETITVYGGLLVGFVHLLLLRRERSK
jgi:hypothetical protein